METMAVAVEGVVEEAVDTAVEAVVVVEAMVEDVSMDTMVVVGGGGCRIFIHKTLNIRPHPQDLHPQNLDSCVHIFQCPYFYHPQCVCSYLTRPQLFVSTNT